MKITINQPGDWKDLQNKVSEIFRECGFNVETEKTTYPSVQVHIL